METVSKQAEVAPENLDFLLQLEYLMEEMTNSHIPLEEGYQRLITLVFNHDQKVIPGSRKQ